MCGDIAGLKPGQIRYTLLLNAAGGIVDDLMIGRPADLAWSGTLYIVVNAGSKDADFALIEKAAAGKAKAAACAGCHGAEGVSVNLPGPTLAGQHEAYLQDALKAYITGGRSDPMMSAMVQGLSNDDAANIAAYFAGAKCVSSLDAAKQATLPGKASAAKCAACHGADGNSTNPSWPNLIGHSKDYLVNALKAYKGGARKNGMMAGIVKDLSDTDMESAAAYYANATCK